MATQNYKSDASAYPLNICGCGKCNNAVMYLENVRDVAKSMAHIMGVCGMHPCKTRAVIEVILDAFLHCEEVLSRYTHVLRKRLCREDLIHDLGRKCLMSRTEAYLAYSLIKRAFKAFYCHESHSVPSNSASKDAVTHLREEPWLYAAKRSANIFEGYRNLFFNAKKNYKEHIRMIYKELYNRLLSRLQVQQLESETPRCSHEKPTFYATPKVFSNNSPMEATVDTVEEASLSQSWEESEDSEADKVESALSSLVKKTCSDPLISARASAAIVREFNMPTKHSHISLDRIWHDFSSRTADLDDNAVLESTNTSSSQKNKEEILKDKITEGSLEKSASAAKVTDSIEIDQKTDMPNNKFQATNHKMKFVVHKILSNNLNFSDIVGSEKCGKPTGDKLFLENEERKQQATAEELEAVDVDVDVIKSNEKLENQMAETNFGEAITNNIVVLTAELTSPPTVPSVFGH